MNCIFVKDVGCISVKDVMEIPLKQYATNATQRSKLLRPVVLIEGKKAEHNPDKNRLTLKILFPKTSGEKATPGQIVLINGDIPQVLVKMPAPIEVIIDDQKGDDAEWSKYLNQWFKK